MPITVAVRSATGPTSQALSLTFDGSRVAIGRGASNDVRLPDPSISARHATIRLQGSDYVLVDEASTNGTWVSGVRLAANVPHALKATELIRVGRVWLEISAGQRPPTADLGLATRDLAFALVEQAMASVGDDTIAKVRVVDGPDIGEELRLVEEGRAYVIGRGEATDLPLADPDASREHAIVTRRGSQVLLRDQQSRNGVVLGEQLLVPDRDVVWRSAQYVRLGRTVLELEEPVTAALSALESAADEALRDQDDLEMASPASDLPLAPTSESSLMADRSVHDHPASSRRVRALQSDDLAAVAASPVLPGDGAIEPEVDNIDSAAQNLHNARDSIARARGREWGPADSLIVGIAVTVIAMSLAGLAWILK